MERPKCYWVEKYEASYMKKVPQRSESSGTWKGFSASLVTLIWSENSLSILVKYVYSLSEKTLSETDFLSVSILDSCIEMPQLHKPALSLYLSMWLEFLPFFLYNSYWIFPWKIFVPHFKEGTFSLHISFSLNFSLLYCHIIKIVCGDGNTVTKSNLYRKM